MQRGLIVKIGLLFLIFFAVSFILGKIFNINLRELQDLISSFGIWSPIVYSVILTLGLSVPLNPVSDYFVVNLAAILLPLPFAIFATFIAHTSALTINYFIGKHFGWKFIERFTTEKETNFLKNLSNKISPSQIFYLRFILPLTAVGIDAVSYAAGISKIPFARFYLASIIPWTILNILFFTFTKLAIEVNIFLFFIPGLLLISIPISIHLVFRKWKKISNRN